MATYPNNPMPWTLQSCRWTDSNGDLIPFTQADERAMFLAKIKDLEDFLEYEKARVQTAEHVTSKANKELNEEMTIRRRLDERVQTLRNALVDLCDSQLSSRDRGNAIARGLDALESTKEGA